MGTSTAAPADGIDNFVTAQMNRQHLPAVSLVVLKGGKPIKLKSYGFANLELATAAAANTVYEIGSISKQFIAAGIVLLSADGKLGLDDSITKYLDDAPRSWRPISIRHLLTHTSGLVREMPGFQVKKQSDIDAIRAAYATPLSFKPGDNFQCSNLGYSVLAEVISRTAKVHWPRYLHERIFAPLGMNATRTPRLRTLTEIGHEGDSGHLQRPSRPLGRRWLPRPFAVQLRQPRVPAARSAQVTCSG